MTSTFAPWLVTSGLLVTALLIAEYRAHVGGKAVTKVLAAACFVGTAWVHASLSSTFALAIFVGLCLSLLGDVALIPTGSKRWFLLGLVAFLLAHVAYMIGFIALGIQASWLLASLLVLLPAGWWVRRWLIDDVPPKLRIAVQAYIVVISGMVACGIGAYGSHPNMTLLPVAASLFFVSDLAVAKQRFKKPSFQNKVWGLPTYFAAQMLFALLAAGA